MRSQYIPGVARFRAWSLAVTAHTRGAASDGGHYSYERGAGARVTGSLELTPLCTEDALRLRAWLHSMRGRSGTFYTSVPNRALASNSCTSEYSQFSDCTGFSDSTTFDDLWTGYTSTTLSGSASADAATVAVTSATGFAVGDWMLVGTQLVRVVGISGTTLTIRPRLRTATSSGTTVSVGPVWGLFRTLDDAPIVPLIPGRSKEFTIAIEEAY